MHQIQKIRALYFINFSWNFIKWSQNFNFGQFKSGFKCFNQGILPNILKYYYLADFFLLPLEKNLPKHIKQKIKNNTLIWIARNETITWTKLKSDCILSNFMKSWQNKVPLFFWFDAYLTLFSVPAFGQLANLKINFS